MDLELTADKNTPIKYSEWENSVHNYIFLISPLEIKNSKGKILDLSAIYGTSLGGEVSFRHIYILKF